MAIGDSVTVLGGPFMGFKGKVIREAGDKLVVAVNLFGRVTEVPLLRSELGLPGASLDILEGEVLEAIGKRGFNQRLFIFWQEQSQRRPIPAEPELAGLYESFSSGLGAERELAQAEALTRFRAGYQSLETAARDAKWLVEREGWAGWKDQAQAVTDAYEQPLFGALAPEAQEAERARLRQAGFELREQIEAWQRKQGLVAAPPVELRNEELELQIEREVDRDEPFLVYSDWLLSKGNPRGELIALQAAGEGRKTAEAALRRRLAPQLLGGLAAFDDRQLEAKWRLGFLQTLRVEATRQDEDEGVEVVKLLEVALRLPSSRFLRELSVACPSSHEADLTPELHAVLAAGGVRPTLCRLAFFTNEDEEMLSWTSAGELAGVAAVFPNLESLEVRAGSYTLTAPRFPRLKSLVLQTCGMTAENLKALAQADWPSLERLELWVGSASHGVQLTVEQFEPLLRSSRLPQLKSLALCNCELTDALCTAVLDAPLLPRLEALTLSKGTMTEVGACALIAGADRLRHLKSIDVDDNYLSQEVVAQLQAALPQTKSAEQRTAEENEGQLHRYASVGE